MEGPFVEVCFGMITFEIVKYHKRIVFCHEPIIKQDSKIHK